ncbi:hypothetical protein CBE37_04865 [bacterium TMED277]|nr:MAG: hypothetical protein CBE37_04865 [bacterium TMED277]
MIYDPSDPETLSNPYPYFSYLRRTDPVHWNNSLKSWVITKYDDVRKILSEDFITVDRLNRFYSKLPGKEAKLLEEIIKYLNLWAAFRNPPDHTRMRKIMMVAFTRKSINQMEPIIRKITEFTLDKLDNENEIEVDLVEKFSSPIPALTIMHLLGVPTEMLENFKSWSDDMSKFIGGSRNDKKKYEKAANGCKQMVSFFKNIIAERRENPAEGFLMDLINATVENEKFSDDELIATCMLVLFAGHETTTNLISNGILTLIKNPKELEKFISNPNLIDATIEEIMRFDGPTNSLVRNIAKDHKFHDKNMKEGDRVFAMVSSANRDETVFENPDSFIIDRSPNRHLTFGFGPHLCIGATLAREEGRIALSSLFKRFPKISLKSDSSFEWVDAMVPRGLKKLSVVLK